MARQDITYKAEIGSLGMSCGCGWGAVLEGKGRFQACGRVYFVEGSSVMYKDD